jgi:hypothetical protein
VPVFLTVGELDTLFCGPGARRRAVHERGGADRVRGSALGANVPSIDAYILPAAGTT